MECFVEGANSTYLSEMANKLLKNTIEIKKKAGTSVLPSLTVNYFTTPLEIHPS